MDNRLSTILALLAKAEATEFPEEAQAFVQKAQELMTKHAINDAMLSAHAGTLKDEIVTTVVTVEAPYSNAKASLVHRIARANDCKSVEWGRAARRNVEIVGFKSDIENVKMLVGSLMIQGIGEMLKAKVPEHEHGKTFRQSFLLAYGVEIGRRLRAGRVKSVDIAQECNTSTALVLVQKEELVTSEYERLHPNTRNKSVNNRSASGQAAGRSAGQRASLGTGVGRENMAIGQ